MLLITLIGCTEGSTPKETKVAANPQNPAVVTQPTSTPVAAAVPTYTPPPTYTPQPTYTPLPTQQPLLEDEQGICYRTPEIQNAIIEELRIPLCRSITVGELQRLRELQTSSYSLMPGDFDNMPNLRELSINLEGENTVILKPGIFVGMHSLKELEITGSRGIEVASNTFQDVPVLKELSITGSDSNNSADGVILRENATQGLSELTSLKVRYLRTMHPRALAGLGELRSLDITSHKEGQGIPEKALIDLPKLGAEKEGHSSPNVRLSRAPKQLHVANPHVVCDLYEHYRHQDPEQTFAVSGQAAIVIEPWHREEDKGPRKCLIGVRDRIITVYDNNRP